MQCVSCRGTARCRLVQITLNRGNDDPRLRRLTCGKASPFRSASVPNNLLRAGWKAEPSSLRGGKQGAELAGKPEAFRKSRRQSRSTHSHESLIWTGLQRAVPLRLAPHDLVPPVSASRVAHTSRRFEGVKQFPEAKKSIHAKTQREAKGAKKTPHFAPHCAFAPRRELF